MIRVPENLHEWITTNKELSDIVKGVNTKPTLNQIKAGNYKKAHVNINGFKITIENPKGSYRCGVDNNGTEWKCKMHAHYGYYNTTMGRDGDHIDVFIGSKLTSDKIYVVDQIIDGVFDEHKVMMGYDNIENAKKGYLSNYTDGWKGLGNITETDLETFKQWLYNGTKRIKPFAEYKK